MTTDRPASGIRLRMSALGCGAMLVRMPGYEMLDADQLRTISHYLMALRGGFSLDASVRIEAHDRPGLERLLRYCARPPFAADRLEEIDARRLIYHLPKPGPDGRTQLILSPLALIGRIAALVPPPRQHRHRYYGVLAPDSPLRPAVTACSSGALASRSRSVPISRDCSPVNRGTKTMG